MQGSQQTLEDPKNPGFCLAWKNALEKPESTSHPWKIMFWSRFSIHQFLALQCCCIFYSCNAGEEDLWCYWGVNAAYHLSCDKQPLFSISGHKISSKTQNERWMGTGRRSICDNYIFRKHSQMHPGKPLEVSRESPGKPWKRISFHCWPPCDALHYS